MTAPAHLWIPPGAAGNVGEQVAELAQMVGRPPDIAQRVAIDAMTSFRPGGRWLCLESLVKEPRQNGKTGGIVTPIALDQLFFGAPDRVAWTAHLFKTCREAFEDHQRLIDSSDELRRRVKKIAASHGEESIELLSGARMDYLARSKGGGRGLGGALVVIDEALFFPAMAAGALLPILAARPGARVIYASSGAKAESEFLRKLTKRGRAGSDPSLIFVEWCAAGSWEKPGCRLGSGCDHSLGRPGCVMDDPDLWRAANPAMVLSRIELDFMRAMRRTLDPTEFGREFLGWDEGAADEDASPITPEMWELRTDPDSTIIGRVAMSVDITPARTAGAIAMAGLRSDGRIHGEVVEDRPGADWIVDRVVELLAEHEFYRIRVGDDNVRPAFALDPAGPAASLLPDLRAAGVEPVLMTARDVGAACGGLQDDVTMDQWRHIGQAPLDMAVAGAGRRDIGDGNWGWGRRKSTANISPLVAVTDARWALTRRERADIVPLMRWA